MRPVNAAAQLLERHLCNAACGLEIHSVNAAYAASYAQTECKEAATAAQSVEMKGSTCGQTGRKEAAREKRNFWGHPRPRQMASPSALLMVSLLAAIKGDALCTPLIRCTR